MKYISLASLLVMLSCSRGGAGRAFISREEPGFPDPNVDPFYQVPANISQYDLGQVIRTRPVPTFIIGQYSGSYQLAYRSNNTQNEPISTVLTMWIPNSPKDNTSILSYQYAEDAINLACAPSFGWVQNSGSNNSVEAHAEGPILIPWALKNGYYVVQPDAEGPASEWIVGRTEGRAVLDGIRAAINFNQLQVAKTRVAMYGYSGGAHSSVWASTLAQAYAPELQIVGAAFGGTPVDLTSTFQLINGQAEAVLAGGAVFGLANGYPTLNANFNNQTLTTQGKAVATQLRSDGYCLNTVSATAKYRDVDFNQYFTIPLLQNPVLQSILPGESLLSNVSNIPVPVPSFPRFQYHGTNDSTVPYGSEVAYVQQQCSKGANIKFMSIEAPNHVEAGAIGLPLAQQFLYNAFNETTAKVVCGTSMAST